LLRSVELALTVVALALLGMYGADRALASVAAAEALAAFETSGLGAPDRSSEDHEALGSATAAPDQSLWGRHRIAAYNASLGVNVPPVSGVLTIPKINLRVPVFEGANDAVLNRGVGRIEGTSRIGAGGNVGLAGHRDGFFRGLKDIAVGDRIELRGIDDDSFYRVTELLIVAPTDVYVLEPSDRATLTLVTCYPFYFIGAAPQRFIVRAVIENVLTDRPSSATPDVAAVSAANRPRQDRVNYRTP
jgi:sortase A